MNTAALEAPDKAREMVFNKTLDVLSFGSPEGLQSLQGGASFGAAEFNVGFIGASLVAPALPFADLFIGGDIATGAFTSSELGELATENILGASASDVQGLAGLKNVRNFVPALTQTANDTCGLNSAGIILNDLAPARNMTSLESLYGQTVYNNLAANGGAGLDPWQLSAFLQNNLEDQAFVHMSRNVTSSALDDLLARGDVISHVDGNHFVSILDTVAEEDATWVRLYDPARGIYEQMLPSFMTRTGPNNQMIHVIPF